MRVLPGASTRDEKDRSLLQPITGAILIQSIVSLLGNIMFLRRQHHLVMILRIPSSVFRSLAKRRERPFCPAIL